MALDLFSAPECKLTFVRRRLALLGAAFLLALTTTVHAEDYNKLVLAQVKAMPQGGIYSVNRLATIRLQGAAHVQSGKFCLLPDSASPSFCSGATYLVFLKTIEELRRQEKLDLNEPVLTALLVRGQADGAGIWGRWNANGPGTARLFYEMGLGRNFEEFERARPGDFMKIFWNSEVGKAEHGHSVVYLGRETKEGVEHVRFWSSNQPAGYGEKAVPRSKIAYAIFSRLENPAALSRIGGIPATDSYLAGLTSVRSSVEEARTKTGM